MTTDDLSSLKIDRDRGVPPPSGGSGVKKIVAVLFLMGAGAAVAFFFMNSSSGNSKTPTEPGTNLPVPATPDRSGPIAMTASGYVVSKQKATLASKVSGRITAITVAEGDVVKEGDVLVQIDDEELLAQLQVERAGLKKAQLDFDRGKKMLASGLISQSEFDHLKSTLDLSDGRVKTVEKQLKETRIVAPFGGTILQKHKEIGEMASGYGNSGSSDSSGILTMADLAQMEAEVDVEEKYDSQITIGQAVEVVAIEAYPDKKFAGRVDRKPFFDRAKRTVRVMVTILDPQNVLKPDMNARVTFFSKPPGEKR